MVTVADGAPGADSPRPDNSGIARVRRYLGHGPTTRPAIKVWLLTVLLASLAVAIFATSIRQIDRAAPPIDIPWPVIAVLFCLGELLDVQVHYRRETHAFSLSEFPTVIGLFFLEPTTYLVALIVGSAAALAIQSREHPLKLAFNLSDVALNGTIALAIFHAMADLTGPPGPGSWLAAFTATLVTSVVAAIAIAGAISLSGGAPQFQKLPEMLQFGGLVALANTSLALLAVSILWIHTEAIWLLVVPVATLFIAYRAYVSEREKHERLELLYESSRILQNSPALDSALLALLEHAREMFRAELAEIVLYPRRDPDGDALRTRTSRDGTSEVMAPISLARGDVVRQRIATDRRAFLHVPGPEWRPGTPAIRQAMTCPLNGERGLMGEMTIANRMTEATSFLGDDLRLLEMIANQAAAALENGQLEQSLAELSRLKEQLRHQAYHDSLTGLPNRALFTEQVDARIARAGGGSPLIPVVLFLDLDDFKVVNDTLGHAAGDRLLVSVAERLAGCIRAGDVAARLGGDEFAILLEDRSDLTRSIGVANRILDALQAPFPMQGKEMVVGGSIGIAVAREAEERAHDLLRKADMAMYTAKSAGKRRLAVFDPTVHASIVARHELSAELAGSIARAELAVHYQPIVDLATLRMTGVEALVRWHHPVRGLVPPDEFVRLAEENGTILELGRWVFVEACDQLVHWKHAGILREPISLAVNLSPIQLQQGGFIEDMEAILLRTGFDAENLIVEMTETAMFRDSESTIAK
ncbi:MAG TPA: diguanylate cyclase, partial [Candidatus Limnocylindrales bacterium]